MAIKYEPCPKHEVNTRPYLSALQIESNDTRNQTSDDDSHPFRFRSERENVKDFVFAEIAVRKPQCYLTRRSGLQDDIDRLNKADKRDLGDR